MAFKDDFLKVLHGEPESLYEAFVQLSRKALPPDADARYLYLRSPQGKYIARDDAVVTAVVFDIALEQVADGVSGKGESDDRDGRADDDGRHDLIDPVYADELDNSSDDDIYESGEECADDEAEPAERHGYTAGKSRKHVP